MAAVMVMVVVVIVLMGVSNRLSFTFFSTSYEQSSVKVTALVESIF